MIGMGGDKILHAVDRSLDEEHEPGKSISARRQAIFLERYAPHLKAAPGARELLERLLADGMRCVVATSAKELELQTILEAAGIADLLHVRTTSDDAERSKPDPDIVGAALQKAEASPEASLLLGDTPFDVEAARKGNVGTVALRCGGWNDDDLAGAIAIYDDPADLLAHYADSPVTTG
jgi:HAD superfamily hydrolase (TIGR01509 family)